MGGVVIVGSDERFVLRTKLHGDICNLLAEENEEFAEVFERDGGFLIEMLFEQALHGGVAALEVGKREELAHEGEEIVALHLHSWSAVGCCSGMCSVKRSTVPSWMMAAGGIGALSTRPSSDLQRERATYV